VNELQTQQEAHDRAQKFFDELWSKGDYWGLETSAYEQAKYASQLDVLGSTHLGRVLELGCGAGHFTRMLAPRAGRIVGVDIAPAAIEQAQRSSAKFPNAEFVEANIMQLPLLQEEQWDLVVLSETMYYIGWLYSFFHAGMLATRIFDATAPGGKLLMCNTLGDEEEWLLLPILIRSYRDLFVNAGFTVETESTFRGTKKGVEYEALITLATKPVATDGAIDNP
jgi:SAM-dependent methyltransferase